MANVRASGRLIEPALRLLSACKKKKITTLAPLDSHSDWPYNERQRMASPDFQVMHIRTWAAFSSSKSN